MNYCNIVLYSQTKGVKWKYILYVLGSVAYRQYIHTCSSLWNPNRLTGGESISLLLSFSGPCLCSRSQLLSLVSKMAPRCWANLLLPCLWAAPPSHSPAGLAELQIFWLPWVNSAANDSPYPSLNTALLASQPYTRRFRISRLAPVLRKDAQFLYQAWEP